MCGSVEYIQMGCGEKDGTFGAIDMILDLKVDVIIGPGCGSGKLHFNNNILIIIIIKQNIGKRVSQISMLYLYYRIC